MRQGGKYKFVWIALVAVVAAVLIMMVPKVRHDSPIPDVPKANEATNHAASVVTENKVQSATKRNDGKRVVRTMRFLELARQFVPEDQRAGIDKDIAKGVDAQPDCFAKFTIQYMEFFGYLKNNGLIEAYYDALKKEYLKNSNDINVLRFLAAIASIPSLNRRNEYEAWLERLAMVDSHEDVLFPYAEMLVEKGLISESYEVICRGVESHPEEMVEILSNSLQMYVDCKAESEVSLIVDRLKQIKMDVFHSSRCGETLYKNGMIDDAAFFYQQCLDSREQTLFRDIAMVRLCDVDIRQDKISDQVIVNLKRLLTSEVPMIRREARKVLISHNIDFENQNNNQTTRER